MSVFSRVGAVRRVLLAGVAVRAIAWSAVTGLVVVLGAAVADTVTPLSLRTRSLMLALSIVAQMASAAAVLWRDRRVWSIERVALWIEEHDLSLHYRLVTAIESGDERLATGSDTRRWVTTARRRVLRAVASPLGAFAVAFVIVLLLPRGAMARLRAPRAGDSLERGVFRRSPAASRLTPLVADITPPAYSGEPATAIDEPITVKTLAGSGIVFRGRGSAAGVMLISNGDTLRATERDGRWSIALSVTNRPAAVRINDRTFQRVVAIEPVVDNPPTVTITEPVHDTVLRTARGRLPLSAEGSDDFGIASAGFEYIVSSGEGETFTFKSGVLGAVRPDARKTALTAVLSLDALHLQPGDMVHVRAVARDANTATGPGVGASETRTIRIARTDEYDSVAVDAAAPAEADNSVVSERMLILLAEALEKRRPHLSRDTLVRESRAIAADQTHLRRTVGDIVFGDPEAGENPAVTANKPLLDAYNAMVDAGTALELGEPARALPSMRRALDGIQRARQAERVYLRGRPPAVVVDVDKARLKGKDRGTSSERKSIPATDVADRELSSRLMRLVALVPRDAQAAADSLLLLRIDALTRNAPLAAALGDAASAVRRGKSSDASAALGRAQHALGGAAVTRDSIARWGIIP